MNEPTIEQRLSAIEMHCFMLEQMLEETIMYLLKSHPDPLAALAEMTALSDIHLQSRWDELAMRHGGLSEGMKATLNHLKERKLTFRTRILQTLTLLGQGGERT